MIDQGHKYFWGAWPEMPWKESAMAIISKELAERLDKIEERLNDLESALSALLKQEEKEDAIHDETA